MPEEITSSVEAIEVESEKILEEARNRAREIILEAREESRNILSSQLPLHDVKPECVRIVNEARAEADKRIEDSEKRVAEIRINANKKAKEIMELIVSIIAGRS